MRGEDIIIMFSVVGLAFLVSAVNEKKMISSSLTWLHL